LLSATHPKTPTRSHKQREEDFPYPTFFSLICKQFNPQKTKATQTKLLKNANHSMKEEDWDFSSLFQPFQDATKTNSDFCRLNL
jgi:hypothetical protein